MLHPDSAARTRFARSGDVNIAFQVIGEGELDIVFVSGAVTNLDAWWELPAARRFYERLGSVGRLIIFDKRGVGLSERVTEKGMWTLEQRMDDVRAVMDAAGSERAAVIGVSEGGPMCTLFAATYPERTHALVLYGTFARWLQDPDYPWGFSGGAWEYMLDLASANWGNLGGTLGWWAPSVADDPRARQWWNRFMVLSGSPSSLAALLKMNREIDVRQVLPAIQVPTLVIHRRDDCLLDVRNARYLAGAIPDAKYVELEGSDHLWFWGDQEALISEVQEFLTGAPSVPEPDRVLKTLLFTDIVDSTRAASNLGDQRWTDLLSDHDRLIREELERFRGEEIATAGDGFLIAFDGPARAIRCACAIRDRTRRLSLAIRAGLHTGECEMVEDSVKGIAVHIASRVSSAARPGEVLVSQTVKDLVAGSEIQFSDRGSHDLRGVSGSWNLFAVEAI